MNEKTLLYGALAFTAIAAGFGVYKARTTAPSTKELSITPVSLSDAKNLREAEVPIRLTAADGTGLRLMDMKVEAAVEDPLALTELHLTFENPQDRQLEGTFRITLPQGASLSRFAMKVGNQWQEGEVVEKQRARQVYEDFLHRKQDPALMEQSAGNEFTARVFPIPARGKKEIVVAYSEVMEAGAPYVLPLRGLPMLGSLDVNVHAAGKKAGQGRGLDATFGIKQTNITPAQDFIVDGKQLPRSAGLRAGDYAIARVVPFAQSRPEPVKSAIVLLDTSASRGLGLKDQLNTMRDVFSRMPGDTRVTVACFDQEVVQVYEGPAKGFGDKEQGEIMARGALGASDVEAALDWALEAAKKSKANRVVIVGDGVATAGETDAQKLKQKVEGFRAAGVERMDAIAMGGIRDDAFLKNVVRGVLDKDGVVLDAKLGADALARRLGEATSSGVPVKVEGARWSWPEKLDGLQAGDEVMVFAQLDEAAPVKITVGTQTSTPDLRTIERPLVERAWAQAKIQSLVDAPTESPERTKQDIIAISTRHRVLSPHTALLVLETERDYSRFNIDRNATVDILTVEDGKVATAKTSREWEAKKLAKTKDKAEKKEDDTTTERAKGAEGSGRWANKPAPALAAEPMATATAAARPAPVTATPPSDIPARELESTATRPSGGAPAGPGNARGGDLDRDGFLADDQRRAQGTTTPTTPPVAEPAPRPQEQPPTTGHGTGQGYGGGNAPPPPPAATMAPTIAASAASPPPPRRPTVRPPTNGLLSEDGENRGRRPPSIGQGGAAASASGAPVSAQVRAGTIVVEGGINESEVQRVLRGQNAALRACYTQELGRDPRVHGRVEVYVVVDAVGGVKVADVRQAPSEPIKSCIRNTFRSMHFPAPGSGDAKFTTTFDLVGGSDAVAGNTTTPKALPYEGKFKTVMESLSNGRKDDAFDDAKKWVAEQPGDVMALVALGESYEAKGDKRQAARAYGSILELFSSRADSRRFAGERLERLEDPLAVKLAVDTYGKAAEQRPDHPASHRLYAFSLLKKGDHEKAFEAMKKGVQRTYPSGRFAGADRILREDLGLIATVWAHAQPNRRGEIMDKLKTAGGTSEESPSLRFVLVWETDANDVDFHIYDGKNGHAYYGNRSLPSGGELYADVTTGYGPECFTIRGPKEQRAYPYALQAHYYSRGPMGYGMGKLQIIDHDGKGNITFEERPFVVMVDRAYVDLGVVEKTKPNATAMKMAK